MSVTYYGDFPEDDTVDIPFNTFTSDDPSASSTITNFVNTDVHIHKDGGTTQRNNAAGITVSVDFDGITGNHLVKIDTSDDTVAGFWVTGSEYQVRIEGTTVDGATINAWIGAFSIERAGGTVALLKLIQAATITNAAGADIAADIIAVKAETAAIVNDTDVIDDGTSGLVKIAQDVAAVLTDTGTTLQGELDAIQAAVITNAAGTDIAADIIAVKAETANILTDTGTTLENRLIAIEADTDVIDDGTSGLVKIAQDVAAALADTNELQGLISSSKLPAQVKGMDANSLTASALNADAVDEIHDEVVEGTITQRQAMKLILAVLTGKVSGGGTTTLTFRDIGDTKDRLIVTVDSDGNRTAVGTRDGS